MIYFVGNIEKGMVKIGYTNGNIKTRISSIKTGCPFDISILRVLEGKRIKESKLHNQFKGYKLRGEWFTLSEEILNYIKETKDFIRIEKSIEHKVTDNIKLFKGSGNYATISCDFCHVEIDINDTKEFYTDKHENLKEYRILNFIKFHPRTTELNKQIRKGVKFYIDIKGCISNSSKEVIRESYKKTTFKISDYSYLKRQ